VAGIREAFGDAIEFGLDFHGRVSLPMARVLLRELEPLRPLFVEEPVLPEFADSYRRLADFTSIPIAAGERMFSRFEFRHVFEAGGLAIVQPDLSHAGGISECVKIGAMAEAYGVALAACLQVDFVSHNAVLQEQSMGIHYNKGGEVLDYVANKEDFAIVDGYIAPLPKPGLGVVIDEAAVIEASGRAIDWRNPVWRHPDGSIAEW
jgi:galactonate dehydratase